MQALKNLKVVKECGLFISDINSVVISDVHLGYELCLANQGLFLPQIQVRELKEKLKKIYKQTKAKTLIINGDLKHEFGEASRQEWREVFDFVNEANKFFKKIVLVRGNHDNYLLTIISKLGLKLYDPVYKVNGYLFAHGHKLVEIDENIHTIIIGHEEPAIVIRRGFDKIKIKCLLVGSYQGKRLIVLPAFSTLSSGSEINVLAREDFLSPFLRKANVDEFEVYGIDEEVGVLHFGKLKNLKTP